MAKILKNNFKTSKGDTKGLFVTNSKGVQSDVKFVKSVNASGVGSIVYDTFKEYYYHSLSVSGFSYDDISAKGTTITPKTLTYSEKRQEVGHSGTKYNETTLDSGATISYSDPKNIVNTTTGAISADNLSTSPSVRTKITTVTVKVSLNGLEATKSFDVYQEANVATYGDVSKPSLSVSDISVNGGSITEGTVTTASTQTITYTSGESRNGEISYVWSGSASGSNLAQKPTKRTKKGTLTCTANGEGEKSNSNTIDVYQSANTVTISFLTQPTWNDVLASGGSSSLSNAPKVRLAYTTGSIDQTYPSETYGTWNVETLSGDNLQNTPKGRTKLGSLKVTYTLKAAYSSTEIGDTSKDSNSVDVYQEANTDGILVSRGTPSVSIGSGLTAAASSATVTCSVKDNYRWTSGYSYQSNGSCYWKITSSDKSSRFSTTNASGTATSGNQPSGNKIKHASMTTDEYTDSVTVTCYNSNDTTKTATASVTDITNVINHRTQSAVIGTGILASGGSAVIDGSCNGDYTSGNLHTSPIKSVEIVSQTGTDGKATTRFSVNGTTLSHTSMGANVGTDYCKVKTIFNDDHFAEAEVSVTNENDMSSHSASASIGQGINAAGGSAVVSGYCSGTYTSGEPFITRVITDVTIKSQYSYVEGAPTVKTTIDRFSVSDTSVLNHTSMGTNAVIDVCEIEATFNDGHKATAIVDTQNKVESYDAPYGLSVTCGKVAAKGGSVTSGTVSGTCKQKRHWTSTAEDTINVTPSGSWSGGASNIASRGTTIGNEQTVGSPLVYTYTANGVSNTASCDVKQNGNYVTSLVLTASMSYAQIEAGATASSEPTKSASVSKYVFSSESETTTKPDTKYGSLSEVSWSGSFSLAKSQNGFTAVNASTGILTATSRGTTYATSARTSASVTCKKATITWTHTATYGGSVASGEKTPTATCSQKKNTINITWSISAGAVKATQNFLAAGGTEIISEVTAPLYTINSAKFDSGSNATEGTHFSVNAATYSWSVSGEGFSVTDGAATNTSTLSVTAANRDETLGAARSGSATRNVSYTLSYLGSYGDRIGGATKTSESKNANSSGGTLTQNENKFESAAVQTGSAGAISVPTFGAAGGSKTVSSTTDATAAASTVIRVTWSSGSHTDYTPSKMAYSWSSANSKFTVSGTSKTTSLVCESAKATYSAAISSVAIKRRATWTYTSQDSTTAKTIYKEVSGNTSRSANVLTTVVITSSNVAGAISGATDYTAAGGAKNVTSTTAATAYGSVNLSARFSAYDDGDTTNGAKTVTAQSLTYSWSKESGKDYVSLTSSNTVGPMSVTMSNRTNGYSESTRSAKIYRTATYGYTDNGTTKTASVSCETTVTQAKNMFQKPVITINGGELNNMSFIAKGESKSIAAASKTAPSISSVVLKYDSGTAETYTSVGSMSAASLTYAMTAATGFSFSSPNVSAANRTTVVGDARSTTVSRKATYTYTLNTGYKFNDNTTSVSANKSVSATATQEANAITSYDDITITKSGKTFNAIASSDSFSNSDAYQYRHYTSESSAACEVTLTGSVKTAKTGFSLSSKTISVTNNKSLSARNGFVVTLSASGEGSKTATKDITYNQVAAVKWASGSSYNTTQIVEMDDDLKSTTAVEQRWFVPKANGTTNPPLWCNTDKNGNILKYNDGGYSLTGSANTTEYTEI